MGKILYLSTRPPEINAPDFNVRQLSERLNDSTDLEIKVISTPIEEAANEHQNYWDVVNELILEPNDITIGKFKS